MAPKRGRRPKKVPAGGYRRDAALDFMRQFGCEDDLIESTLDELLAVYTEDAWKFIEEDCYSILFEATLAKTNPAPDTGNQVEALGFDLENGGAITETDVGADDAGNVERAITIQSSVGDAGDQEEPVAEESGDEGTEAWKLVPVGEASVMQSERTTVGDLVVSTEADDGGPRSSRQSSPAPLRRRRRRVHECFGWLSDDESDEEDYKEHHVLQLEPAPLSGNFQRSPQRRPLATDPVSKGNDTKLFSFGGVELQCDKSPKPSGRNELACPLPARDGESSGSEYMDLEDDDCFDSGCPTR